MKRFVFFLLPILLAIAAFAGFSFFLSQNQQGKGALQVTSIPPSTVYINGKQIGKTPLCQCEAKDMLPSGEYLVKLVPISGDNLLPFEQKVTIAKSVLTVVDRTFGASSASSGFVINLTPLTEKNQVGLFVSSFPTDATLTVDGNAAGNTPILLKTLTDSDHELILSKSGYGDKTVHIHTNKGYQLNAIVTLGLLPPSDATSAAQFSINSALTPVQKQQVTILDTPTGFLRVRFEPSLGASEEAQVKPGDTFDFVDQQNGWYEIKLTNGQTGWISTQYAQKK